MIKSNKLKQTKSIASLKTIFKDKRGWKVENNKPKVEIRRRQSLKSETFKKKA